MQSEKFKEALKVVIAEIKNATEQAEINSIEFVLTKDKTAAFEGLDPNSVAIMGGTCRWDKVKRKVVCS